MEEVWSLIRQGGPTMVPLLLCSVVALAVALERFWVLRRSRVLPDPLTDRVGRFPSEGDPEELLDACHRHPGALAAVVRTALIDPPRDRDVAVERVQAAGRRSVRHLDRGLLVLEIVAAISPLLGLFGTVLGMFSTFQVIAEQGLGDPGALSGGISEALITTIVGLGIAIPTVVAHGSLAKKVDDLVLDVEEHGERLLRRLYPDGRTLGAAEVDGVKETESEPLPVAEEEE